MSTQDHTTDAAVRDDERLQIDPEMHEGKVGWGRITMTAILAIGVIILVLYGINAK